MTQIFVKYILHLCIFRHLKLEIALAIPASNDEIRTPTLVYLDPGMHPGLEVKGLNQILIRSGSSWTYVVLFLIVLTIIHQKLAFFSQPEIQL